jgi:hypothetical protein
MAARHVEHDGQRQLPRQRGQQHERHLTGLQVRLDAADAGQRRNGLGRWHRDAGLDGLVATRRRSTSTARPGRTARLRTTVFKGLASSFEDTGLQNKVKYVYTVTGLDDAGNKAVDTVSIIPGAKLYSPARGSSVKSPPLLAWAPVAGAKYYNVQLYFGVGNVFRRSRRSNVSGRKCSSAWPLQPHYRSRRPGSGTRRSARLARGHYRWYVYPGLGKRSANKYGPLIGSSDFFVVKR